MKRKLLLLLCIFLLSIMALHNIQEDKENTLTEIPIMCNTTSASDRQIESNDNLAANIEAISNTDSTRYSVYVAYPNENRAEYIYQSEPMRSASMIKVFLLSCAMEKVRSGELSLETPLVLHSWDKVGGAGVLCGYADESVLSLDTVLRLMITESDNTATNLIIDLLGMNNINAYIIQKGYYDTQLNRKMMDFQAVSEGRENYTSVSDLGAFFLRLYRHECVGYDQDEVMLSYLYGQTDTECFPTALPGADIAHKTGELVGLYDDGGIINYGGRDIVLIIMTEHYSSRYIAIEKMKEMALCAVNN